MHHRTQSVWPPSGRWSGTKVWDSGWLYTGGHSRTGKTEGNVIIVCGVCPAPMWPFPVSSIHVPILGNLKTQPFAQRVYCCELELCQRQTATVIIQSDNCFAPNFAACHVFESPGYMFKTSILSVIDDRPDFISVHQGFQLIPDGLFLFRIPSQALAVSLWGIR